MAGLRFVFCSLLADGVLLEGSLHLFSEEPVLKFKRLVLEHKDGVLVALEPTLLLQQPVLELLLRLLGRRDKPSWRRRPRVS